MTATTTEPAAAKPRKRTGLPSYLTAAERDMVRRFKKDTAKHQMTVLHDDGLYRHLRFRAADSGMYWYDLVTWPGVLVVNGDCGSFTFSRETDMFGFFRLHGHHTYGINPRYWSEKLPTNGRGAAKAYSKDVFLAELKRALTEHRKGYKAAREKYETDLSVFTATPQRQRYPWKMNGPRLPREPMEPNAARQLLVDAEVDGDLDYQDGARRLLSQLQNGDVVYDVSEWPMTDYAWEFLWCCHAIAAGIRAYDKAAAKAAAKASRDA